MGCCASKDDVMGAYSGPPGETRAAPVASPPAQMRKGSIAAFNEDAEELQKAPAKTWDSTRRQPVRGESFKPERQASGRRASVVCVLKDQGEVDFICDCLGKHPLFMHLSQAQIAEIASVMEVAGYIKNCQIYHSWEHGDAFFLIRKGRVKFTQPDADAMPPIGGLIPAGRKMSVNMAATAELPAGGGEQDLTNKQPSFKLSDTDKASLADGGDMELGPGSAFGELAGVWSSRRGFTATTLEECELFTIDREALRRSITMRCATDRANACQRFSRVKLVAEMQATADCQLDILSFADSTTETTHADGDVLFGTGTPMDKFIMIARGEVSLQLDGVGEEIFLTRGDYFGEAGLACGGLQWSGTAKCASSGDQSVIVKTITRSAFQAKFGTGAGDAASAAPALSGSTVEEREGYLIAASDSDVPAPLQGRKYSEFQRYQRIPGFNPRSKTKKSPHDVSGLDEPTSTEPDEVVAPCELDGKNLKYTDFTFCVELNGASEWESKTRLVGSAYWAGHEGWRSGVRVYMCTLKGSKKNVPYAIRVYDKAAVFRGNGLNEALAEMNLIKDLNHPRLLKLLHCFHDERLLFYVMPLVQGTTVGALMAGQPFKFIPEPWAKHYTLQTISALRYLHCKGIVHRNIYPDSMLVHSDGWLVLGGTMLMRQPRKDARLWTVCGVPDYLAPETIQGFGQSRMTDMWSLGILIHEMMTSKVPFDGEDPLDAMRRILLNESEIIVQGNAVDLVTKLLHPKPSERLGFSGGRSPASVRDAFSQVTAHEWFSDMNVEEVLAGEGETPHSPHSWHLGQMLEQTVEDPPWSMRSKFLSDHILTPEEQGFFEDF